MGYFPGKREWTPEEDEKMIALLDSGVRVYRITGLFPGRTPAAVKSRARVLRPYEPEFMTERKASALLREACLDLFFRTANRYRISMDDAMARHLGHYEPPKIIRAPLKTASAQRLAA